MYINQQGDKVSVEEMQKLAQEAEISIEDYAKAMGYSLQSDKNTSEVEEVDFQTDAAAGADVVSQPMTAPTDAPMGTILDQNDTESQPVDTSLDSPDLANEDFTLEQFELMTPKEKNALSYSEKQRLSREKNNEKNNVLDEIESEASKKFKSGALRVGSNLAQIPAFINRLKMTTLMGIAGPAFKEDIDKFKKLDSATQDRIAQAIGSFSGGPIGDIGVAGSIGLEAAENLKNKAKKIEETLTKYDNTIGQDFIEGNISQAVSRTFNEVIGTIPSIAQAFVPYVGISSIVAGSAADYSTEALAEGKKLDAANMIAATATGFSEGLLELTTKKIGKGLFKSLAGKSKDVVSKTLKEAALQTAKEAGQEGLSESTTEVLNRSIDALYKNKGNEWDNIWPELADVFIIGAAAGGGMSGTGNTGSIINKAVQVNSVNRTLQENNSQSVLDSFEKDPISKETINIAKNKYSGNILDIELKNKVSNGDISVEESKSIKQKFDVTRKNIQLTSDLKINENLIQETIGLLDERESLSSEIAKAKGNKSLVQTQQSRLNDIDSRLSKISTENKLSITTKTVEKLAKDVKGLTIESLDNAEAITNFIEENNIDIDSEKASNEQGFIYQNPKTGEQTIVINKEIATKDRAVNVAAHEFLHGLLFQTVKNSPETQIALGKSLNEFINKIDTNQIKDSNFAKRLESYKDMDEATQSEEVLTLFSDAIATGDIQFNESVFTKIGDVIRRTLQNLGVKVKFNNGKDVYNFVKDYNKSIEKGKLTKAQKAVGKKGAEGALVLEKTVETEPGIKESKASLQAELNTLKENEFDYDPEQFQSLVSNLETKINIAGKKEIAKPKTTEFDTSEKSTIGQINNLVPKDITTNKEYKENKKVQNEIDKAFKPNGIISNIIKGRFGGGDLFIETLNSVKNRAVRYDPAAERKKAGNNDPVTFAEFIFSNVNFSKLDAAKKLAIKAADQKKKTNLDNKEAQSKTTEESSVSTADTRKTYRSLISNPKLIPGFIVTEIKNKLTKITKNLTSKLSTRPKGKNAQTTPLIEEIKKAIGKVVGDLEAIPKQIINRMGNPKDGSYQKFLIDSKKSILENMTTTYLMTAIPAAVEKSVGGAYVLDKNGEIEKDSNENDIFKPKFVPYPEWVGKEIDREKVSTNKKGNTAGNQIVRRAIQVEVDGKFKDSITDEDFVANFVGSDGKVIRGKRESLGKALAEEAGFEVLTKELANEKSDIRKAFEGNQAALKETLADNFVEQISRDAERGTVKFSTSGFNSTEAFKFNLNKNLFFMGVMGLKDLSKDNIKKIFLTTYNPNDFRPKIIDGVAGQFAKLLTPVNRATESVPIPLFKQILIEISNQADEGLALQKLVGATKPISVLSNDESTILLSRGAVIENSQLIVDELGMEGFQLLWTFTKPTYSASGAIGKGLVFENGKLVKSKRSRGGIDLFSGKVDVENNLLKAIKLPDGKKIKTIETNKITLESGEIITRKYKLPPASVQVGMLKEGYKSNAADIKAAQTFVTKFFENLNKQDIDPNTKALMIGTFNDGSNNALRASAPVWGKSKVMPYANLDRIKKIRNGKVVRDKKGKIVFETPYRFEHAIPARVVLAYLYHYHVNNNKDINIEALWSDYRVTIIPTAEMDSVLDETGYAAITTSEYVPGETAWWNRYYNLFTRGKMPYAMVSYDGKEIVGESYEKYFDEKSKKLLIEADRVNKAKEKIIDQKAINNGRSISFSKSSKKIRVFDFDDTLARTKSNVLYTMPDGSKGKIDAATFAKDANIMQAEGAIFDFSEFSKVMDGKKGPLFEVAKKIAQARGTKDVFVLTARPQDAAGPIQEFLAELGLDIPLENITGLADGDPKAKANWMVSKVAEGYNDFYFADDHLGNVKAVKDVFDTFDVKGKVQQAKIKFSQGLDKGFNDMIERQTGTESFKEFSKGVAQRRGKKVGKFKIFVSPSAEDFRGLTQYKFAGKGKQGEADQKFFEEALMDPYFKGVAAVEAARETIKNDTKALFKVFKPVKKKLNKLVPGIDFTYDGAVRVYLWNKAGIEIPGLTERDNKKLNDAVANDPELSAFADALLLVSKQDTWPAPTEYWEAKTTLSDLNTLTEKTNRKEYLTEFIENVDIIFSEKNLNKVEALYGKASRVAIENAIYAMKTGSNSPNQSGDGITNRWLQWVNNSIGTIMFFNRRSALLQLTSVTNFLNWSDNNPAKAALAFANQPQYWKDWAMIFNSDKLKQRRSGLKSDVQEAEIANAAKNTEDKIGSIIAYLLKIGFSPTQIADSIAISSGGATFYRNRVNSLKKKGFSVAEAEAQAFKDFSKLSDEAQQSGDPALVSQQQRSVAGRLILSFQNTTMQYTRLMKKAGQDLINRRGDDKTNVSKILYYGALQNFIFNALSQTAFALIPGFDEDEDEDQVKRDEKLEEKASRVLNGMTDSIIRGTGIYGAVVTTIKNTYKTWEKEADKGFVGDQAKTILEAANISPAIGSKLRKIYSAIQAYQFDKAVMEKHPWSVTIDGKFNPSPTYSVIGNLASATLNLPLDRALAEARGVAEMFDNRNSEMQRIALALGWRTWNVGAENEEFDLIKMETKQQKKEDKKATRAKEKAQYKAYLRKVAPKMSLEEANTYRGFSSAKLKKEYILKLGEQKGIK